MANDADVQMESVTEYNILNVFPFDVITNIFSYVAQEECLTAMAVCRNWYDRVPVYSETLWKTLKLGGSDMLMINKRLGRCLEGHVKDVFICFKEDDKENDGKKLCGMMQFLLDHRCNEIESIGIAVISGVAVALTGYMSYMN